MHVILDTSILVNNYRLDTPRFQGLFAYLKKTKSKLYLPELVMKEMTKKYKEHLTKYINDASYDQRILFGAVEPVDVEKLNNEYQAQFVRIYADKKIASIKSRNHTSEKIFERALFDKAPFDANGRGIRDALIWFDIVSAIKESTEFFCFISANTKDFGKDKLHKDLQEDVGTDSDKLLYFNSIESFLSVYGEQISFIDKDLFIKFFRDKNEFLLSEIDKGDISRSSIEEIPRDYDIIEVDSVDINNINIDDFYIYSSDKDQYKVQVELGISLELDTAVYKSRSEDYDEPENMKGYSYCWVEMSLIINKSSRAIEIDKTVPVSVWYAI